MSSILFYYYINTFIFHRIEYNSQSKFAQDKDALAQKFLLSAQIKILNNFLQIISIISSLRIDWNNEIQSIFPTFKIASGNLHQVISLECIYPGISFLLIFC